MLSHFSYYCLIAALLFFLPLFAAEPLRADTSSPETVIVVGGNKDYPPYEFLDKDGNPIGYNVDLTTAIANVMGIKVQFRLGPWVDVRKEFDAGKVDVLQGMSYSHGRANVVAFSIPHTMVNHSVYARKGTPAINALEELDGKEVAFHNRGFMHDFLREKKVNVKVVATGTQAEALRLVASGKVDYAIVASLPAAYLIKEHQLTNVVNVARSIASVKYCFAFKKENTELLAKFNEGLAILKQTGQYQQIYDKWLGVLEPFGVPWRRVVIYGSGGMFFFLILLAGSLLWSRTLKEQVSLRTAALEREIQERKRSEEELRLRQQQLVQADKMASLGILVSGVAHEINNPNALILLNAPMVIDYIKDTRAAVDAFYEKHGDFSIGGLPYSRMRAKIPSKVQEVQESARKIKRIVEDLKGFSRRDEAGDLAHVDIHSAIHAAVRLLENTIRKSTSHFAVSYAPRLPKIKGNGQRIEQVIVNLILNACQALRHKEERILLTTQYDHDRKEIVVEIRDEGEGISPAHVSHLTDPFFTTKRERGGTGLGLSVSAGIVKEHRGTLEFNSAVGRGTTVTLRLPALPEGANA